MNFLLQAAGASVRIFDLMDMKPKLSNENGKIIQELDGRMLLFSYSVDMKRLYTFLIKFIVTL